MAAAKILLVSTRLERLKAFSDTLRAETQMEVLMAVSADEALNTASREKIAMAVIDDRVGETTSLELVRRLIAVDAFIFTVVLSDSDEDLFHQQSEGLGILARLPVQPGEEDARRACMLLKQVQP